MQVVQELTILLKIQVVELTFWLKIDAGTSSEQLS